LEALIDSKEAHLGDNYKMPLHPARVSSPRQLEFQISGSHKGNPAVVATTEVALHFNITTTGVQYLVVELPVQ